MDLYRHSHLVKYQFLNFLRDQHHFNNFFLLLFWQNFIFLDPFLALNLSLFQNCYGFVSLLATARKSVLMLLYLLEIEPVQPPIPSLETLTYRSLDHGSV